MIRRSVTDDLDVDFLSELHFSMGPTMLSTQINDIKVIHFGNDQPREYQVRVAIQTWLDTTTITYWDLTVIETDTKKYKTGLQYLVKARDRVAETKVEEHRVFPGFTYRIE
ncbi:hypothetical protein H8B09_10670 [Paenibacillus sp. PR3]|uniref:Uncharacterized protein n=1 Tax=Paenibacillus terricola TaxID=2763503 RepID=A0ABR8MVB8_9BACL|nr:hypothetical protein [Paenibacillus terricola]MBD3919216.1 hypothetical protein [Paenibacillus terricola]